MNILKKLDLSLYDTEAQEFIKQSILYAKKSKSYIEISKVNEDIYSLINLPLGTFFGGFKRAFLKLIIISEDFLILPLGDKSNFGLRITVHYEMSPTDSRL
ncbi:MAG: hypothetical protein J6B80_02530 [Clostridia bacterium]|nr:hypothetical protein [Clostridia bacterium]